MSNDASVADSSVLVEWEAVLASVGGDEDFLAEVLGDLITEANGVCEEIEAGFANADIAAITKAAHRIKGSASYLCCLALRDKAQALQYAGQQVKAEDTLEALRHLFEEFKDVLQKTRDAIVQRKSVTLGEGVAVEAEISITSGEAIAPIQDTQAENLIDLSLSTMDNHGSLDIDDQSQRVPIQSISSPEASLSNEAEGIILST
jgi:HPt (histidine-containing phosphotransfer) domain-containing protein